MWEGKRGGEVEKKGRSLVKFNTNSKGNDTLVFLLDLGLGARTRDQYANVRNPFVFTCVCMYVCSCVGVRVWDFCFSLLLLSWANKRRASRTKAACLHTNFYWLFLFVLNTKYREAAEAVPPPPLPTDSSPSFGVCPFCRTMQSKVCLEFPLSSTCVAHNKRQSFNKIHHTPC